MWASVYSVAKWGTYDDSMRDRGRKTALDQWADVSLFRDVLKSVYSILAKPRVAALILSLIQQMRKLMH